MSEMKTETKTTAPLHAITPLEVKQDLTLSTPSELKLEASESKDIEAKASEFVEMLLAFQPNDVSEEEKRKSAVEGMGASAQMEAAKQSSLLKQPLRDLSKRGEDGGQVANALIDLKMKVEELDPSKLDLQPGWLARTLGNIPGIGNPLKRYFSKFESGQTVIAAIVGSLEKGRDQLLRDNITLTEDQKRMRELTHKLQRAISLAQAMDQKLEYKLAREIPAEDPKHKFVQEELIFPLRQRTIDLQQQLAVNQQGVIAMELIIRNNKELVRGVNRSLSVTVSALHVAATVALALANQKIVLDKIDAVSKTTSDLIAGTAERLKTQGTAIHKQAASAQISMESLKSAFADLKTAMDDVSRFRVEALPQMAQTVLELNQLSGETEKSIQQLEKGNKAKPEIRIEA